MRKRLQNKEIEVLRELLLSGLTSAEAAQKMEVSVATVSNYRAYFKKKGDVFPNNRGRKSKNSSKSTVTKQNLASSFSDTYKYNINGIQVTFSDKPKALRIGKKGLQVEY
jgi:transposase